MERIHNLLRKIQDVYYTKGEKQVIDVDLMLDYTRVLYADLLDWRQSLEAKVPVPAEQEVVKVPEAVSVSAPATVVDPVDSISEEEPAPLNTAEDESQAVVLQVEEEPIVTDTEIGLAAIPEEEMVHPEEEIATIIEEAPEVPAQAEAPLEEIQVQEEAEALAPVIESMEEPILSEIHFELPVVQDEAIKNAPADYVFQRDFRDVRSYIGINDKYQYMNELFGNNKTAYEETLDKINFCSNFQEAEQWISSEAQHKYHWAEDDVTYQALLTTVKKYFA